MKTIILIAFYFRPYKGVGAFRISYWYDRLINDGYNVKVITSMSDDYGEDKNIIQVPINTNSFGTKIISDLSFIWGIHVRKCLKRLLIDYPQSVVIMTGGPFLHFGTLLSFKKKFRGTKWIIDYRDPLANHPWHYKSTLLGKLKRSIKRIYERYVNYSANVVLTVNNVCGNLIEGNTKFYIIDNGFDERVFIDTENKSKENVIVYAGKLYESRGINITPFLNACIEISNMPFYYIGNSSLPKNVLRVKDFGVLDYNETAKILSKSMIGLVLASGDPFESTTKIFDYFAAQLKILIITNGEIKTGTLHEITKENPNVEWASNNSLSIKNAIYNLSRPYQDWDYSRFSRNEGYQFLKKVINEL